MDVRCVECGDVLPDINLLEMVYAEAEARKKDVIMEVLCDACYLDKAWKYD